MRENASLSGCIGQFDLEFVEREATPKFLMKLGIQLHLSGLSLSNTVSIIEVFGVERSRSTVHNWVPRQIFSRRKVGSRHRSRLMKPSFNSTMSNIGCTLRLTPKQTNSSIHGLKQPQTVFLPSDSLLNSATNTTLMMRLSSSTARTVSTPPAHDSASPTTFNAMATETVLKGYSGR